ncbi:MAG: glycosyltransferase [Bacteroidales bacterium]|nr:glycosyltransferase [Bacteroidales bacterium]
MKIGIVTFWSSQDNYGQLLQCFALQHYLRSLGHVSEIIRFNETPISNCWRRFKISKLSPIHVLQYFKYRRGLVKKSTEAEFDQRKFDDFRKESLSFSSHKALDYKELWTLFYKYDTVIAGSDQIWSPRKVDLRPYFLQFTSLNTNRISYAASFGRQIWEDNRNLNSLLESIDHLSVRENSGAGICESVGRQDVVIVCDPTLLWESEEYVTHLNLRPIDESQYAFAYFLHWPTQINQEEVQEFLNRHSLHLRSFATHEHNTLGYPLNEDMTIEGWLSALYSSKLVITNSFHGLVFSLIFHKPMVVFPLYGKSSAMNTRIRDLLKLVGLDNRLYTSEQSIEHILESPIDWNYVDEQINRLRLCSKGYLTGTINKKRLKWKPRSIVFVTNGGVHPLYGGLERVTEVLADWFDKQGIKTFYVSFTDRKEAKGGKQLYLPNKEQFDHQDNVVWFNEFIQKYDIDVIINQEGNVGLSLPLEDENKSKLINLSVLHFAPNYIGDDYFKNKITGLNIADFWKKVLRYGLSVPRIESMGLRHLRKRLSRCYRKILSQVDGFILLSHRYREELASLIDPLLPSNVGAINNPVTFTSKGSDQIEKERRALFVGRLENSQKRIDLMLEAWKEVEQKNNQWCLDIVGSGPHEIYLKNLAQKLGLKRVIFHGHQDPREFYERASLFLYTAGKAEGWGLVLVEAQKFGCIPVAMDSYAALRDIITDGENGFIVPDGDISKFSKTILHLMQNETLIPKIKSVAIQSTDRFSIDRIGNEWLSLFSLMHERKSR